MAVPHNVLFSGDEVIGQVPCYSRHTSNIDSLPIAPTIAPTIVGQYLLAECFFHPF